jgi:diguanylate cyclase (GGDEF)-like protein
MAIEFSRQKLFFIYIRLLIPCFLALCLAPPTAIANQSSNLDELDRIRTLSDQKNTAALKQLIAFKQHWSDLTDNATRFETLKLQIDLLTDAGDSKSAFIVTDELLQWAQLRHDQEALLFASIFSAQQLSYQGQAQAAIDLLKKNQAAILANKKPELVLRLHHALANSYNTLGALELSLQHRLEALRASDLQANRQIQTKLPELAAIAVLYNTMKNVDKAQATINEGLFLAKQHDLQKALVTLTFTEAYIFHRMGQFDKALVAYKKALELSIEVGLTEIEETTLGDIADLYLSLYDYKQSEHYSRLALAKAEQQGDNRGIAVTRHNLGLALAGLGHVDEGIKLSHQGIQYFIDTNAIAYVEGMTGELASLYARLGRYKEALATGKKQMALSKKMFNVSRVQALKSLQAQFDEEQKQKKIAFFIQDNKLKDAILKSQSLGVSLALLLVLVTAFATGIGFLLYRRTRKSNENLLQDNTRLTFEAEHDSLTGLENRRSFVNMMRSREALNEAARRLGDCNDAASLILLDVDHFKEINDQWGHAIGDSVLKEIADRLKQTVRGSDMVLRWGGEEFLIFSPKSNVEQCTRLVDRLLKSIGEKTFEISERRFDITVTAGFISIPVESSSEEQTSWEQALQIADKVLYFGKENGRNRAYGLELISEEKEKTNPLLLHDIEVAISEGMIELIAVMGPKTA